MSRARIITDQDGRRWRVMPRGSFAHMTGRQLVAAKQQVADQERAKGNERLAKAIEDMLWIRWALEVSAMYTWKEPA